jgi:inward rectifier potassium channel
MSGMSKRPKTARKPRARRSNLSGREFLIVGMPRRAWHDLYHQFMTVRWRVLFAGYAGFFFLFNLLFAAIYSLQPNDLANLNPPNYWGRFFFSFETFATIGYGDMHPQTVFAHIVASIEAFLGLISLALITGMMFARFSRPTARFLFAQQAVIRTIDGRLTLMLRAANARQNIVMEASAQLRLLRDEVTPEGFHLRRLRDLPLVRSHHPAFLFGWTLLHVIDEASPLAQATSETLDADRAALILSISGTDETTGQTMMARQVYPGSALHWNHAFIDTLTPGKDGVDSFDYTRFHEVVPLVEDSAQAPIEPIVEQVLGQR